MRSLAGRKTFLWAREHMLPRVAASPGARWLACPASQPTSDPMRGPGPSLDGGDNLMVGNGRDVLCGVDAHSTGEAGSAGFVMSSPTTAEALAGDLQGDRAPSFRAREPDSTRSRDHLPESIRRPSAAGGSDARYRALSRSPEIGLDR